MISTDSARAVTSVVTARTNGALIEAVAPLYINLDGEILDATYGLGKWWTKIRPAKLWKNDKDPALKAPYDHDFTNPPGWWRNKFDTVCFDPPYVSKGGRNTTGIADFDARYGLYGAPANPLALFEWIDRGIKALSMCVKPEGYLLVKCCDFISSGKYVDGYTNILYAAAAASLDHVDTFIHVSGTGPQPKTNRDGSTRRQVHSRRAHSYLVVFQRPKAKRLRGPGL